MSNLPKSIGIVVPIYNVTKGWALRRFGEFGDSHYPLGSSHPQTRQKLHKHHRVCCDSSQPTLAHD